MARIEPESSFIAGGRAVVMARGPAAAGLSLGLQRQTQDGRAWVAVPAGGTVGDRETVRGIADGMAPFKTVAFLVWSLTPAGQKESEVLRQIATAGAGGGANAVFAAPAIGSYVLFLEVDRIAQAQFRFGVVAQSSATPPPDRPPEKQVPGSGLFQDVKTIVLVGALAIGAVAVLPLLRR